MAHKIINKFKEPKFAEFSRKDLVIDIKNGVLYYKSNLGVHRISSGLATDTFGSGDVTNITQYNVGIPATFKSDGIRVGNSSITGTLTITGDSIITGDTTIGGDTTITGNIIVGQSASFGNVIPNPGLNVNAVVSNTTASNNQIIGPATFFEAGDLVNISTGSYNQTVRVEDINGATSMSITTNWAGPLTGSFIYNVDPDLFVVKASDGKTELKLDNRGNLDIDGGLTADLPSATRTKIVFYDDATGIFTHQSASLIGGGLISGSGQLASNISGAFNSVSASLAADIVAASNTFKSTGIRVGDSVITGSLTVTDTIIAQEFHTEFVSASIIYESGSTKFGDTQDDNHDFTGSLNLSGSVNIQGSGNITASGDISASGHLYISASDSITPNLAFYNTNNGELTYATTSSFLAGLISSSAQIASDISGAANGITGSLLSSYTFLSSSTQIATDISGSWQGQNFISSSQTFLSTGQRNGDSAITGSLHLTGSTSNLTIDGTSHFKDNVGIGVTPNTNDNIPLHIKSINVAPASQTPTLLIESDDAASQAFIQFKNVDANYLLGNIGDGGSDGFFLKTVTPNKFPFFVSKDASSFMLSVNQNKVGIGYSTPSHTLHVSGNIVADGSNGSISASSTLNAGLSNTNNANLVFYNTVGGELTYATTSSFLSGLLSSSTQIATEISGAFGNLSSSFSASIATNTTNITSNTSAINTLNSSGLLSSSNQIATDISGAFNGVTGSFLLNTTDTLTGDLTVTNNITASNNISASGNLFGNEFNTPSSFAKLHSDGKVEARSIFTFGTNSTDGFIRNASTAGDISIEPGTTSGILTLKSANTSSLIINKAHITASGNISSSAGIAANHYLMKGHAAIAETSDKIAFGFENNTAIQIGKSSNPTEIIGNITASGNISASGHISASAAVFTNLDNTTTSNTVFYNDTTGELSYGTAASVFTAEGISGSFTILSSSFSASIATNTTDIATLNAAGLLSSSAQIASDISGSWQGQNFISASQTFLTTGQRSGDSAITGSLTVTGTITAQEFHTEFVSASIIFESGSTKFGDTSNDVHSFSGSLRVTGSGNHYFTDGKVGIGTTSPEQALTIESGYILVTGSGASGYGYLLDRAGLDRYEIRHLDGGLTIKNATDNRKEMTFDGAGNVGIGNNNPSEKLTVQGNISSSGNISASTAVFTDLPAIPQTTAVYYNRITGQLTYDTAPSSLHISGAIDAATSSLLNSYTFLSSSAQIATEISGAFTILSSSFSASIATNTTDIATLTSATSSYVQNSQTSSFVVNSQTGSFLLNTTDTLDGDLTVTGTITAQEFHTEFVSASIIFTSGSTQFGNSADDIATFSGSINVKDNGHITASGNISASGRVYGTHFGTGNANRNAIDFGTNNTLQFRLNDGSRITHTTTVFRPSTDEAVSLGRTAQKWKELVVKHITASGNISASGIISGSNLSGINTGDQDLSSYIQNSQTSSFLTSTSTASIANGTVRSLILSSSIDENTSGLSFVKSSVGNASTASVATSIFNGGGASDLYMRLNLTNLQQKEAGGDPLTVKPKQAIIAYSSGSVHTDNTFKTTFSHVAKNLAGVQNTSFLSYHEGNDAFQVHFPGGLVSSSAITSPSQGILTVNGVNVDLGLQTTDSPMFNDITASGDISASGRLIVSNNTGQGSQFFGQGGDSTVTINSPDLNYSKSSLILNGGLTIALGGNITASNNISASGKLFGGLTNLSKTNSVFYDPTTGELTYGAAGNISSIQPASASVLVTGNISQSNDGFGNVANGIITAVGGAFTTEIHVGDAILLQSSSGFPSEIFTVQAIDTNNQLTLDSTPSFSSFSTNFTSSLQAFLDPNLLEIKNSDDKIRFFIDKTGNIRSSGSIYLREAEVLSFDNESETDQYITGQDNSLTIVGDNRINLRANTETRFQTVSGTTYTSIAPDGIDTNGNITASGNISASGKIKGDEFDSNGHQFATYSSDKINFGNNTDRVIIDGSGLELGDNANFHVTASGNISASGDLFIKSINLSDSISANHVTASGNISSSGTIHGENFKLDGDLVMKPATGGVYDTILENDGTTVIVGSPTREMQYNGVHITLGGLSNQHTTASGNLLVKKQGIFEEHITASGNISASGDLYFKNAYANDQYRLQDSSGTSRHVLKRSSTNTLELGNSNFTEGLLLSGNVTASNSVSASGKLFGGLISSSQPSVVFYNDATGELTYATSESIAGSGGSADNLGNHTATEDLKMGSNDIVFTSNGIISSSTYLQIKTAAAPTKTLQIGSQNDSWAHYQTNAANGHYFQQKVVVDNGGSGNSIIASFDQDLVLRRDYDDTSYNQIQINDGTLNIKLDNADRLDLFPTYNRFDKPLHISSSTSTVGLRVQSTSGGTNQFISVESAGYSNNQSGILFKHGTNTKGAIGYNDNDEVVTFRYGTGTNNNEAGSFNIKESTGNYYFGVGTETPSVKLEVNGSVKATINASNNTATEFLVSDGGIIKSRTAFQMITDLGALGSQGTAHAVHFNDSAGTPAEDSGFLFDASNGGKELEVTGDVIAFSQSDKHLKDNITPISNPIKKILQIGGYTFDWNKKQDTYNGHDVGVIAQEIEKVLPEVVKERENGYKAVKYEKIVPLLIEGIKDQQKQINELKELITKLTNK